MKAAEYVDWLRTQAVLRRPYWYGTFGCACTDSLLRSRAKQYPAHYGPERMERYRQDIEARQFCGDSVGGAIKWAVWSDLGKREVAYQSEGCPDTSADGMFAHCRKLGMEWGGIDTLPEEPGVALRRSGHVGVYIGSGRAVEWRGFDCGCVMSQVAGRGWTHWYRLPWVEADPAPAASAGTALLGSRPLDRGSEGDDVRMLQRALNALAFNAGGEDGVYDRRTAGAVRRMQQAAGIGDDGVYGTDSHAALMAMISESENGKDAPDAGTERLGAVRAIGERALVRSGAGVQYDVLTMLPKGRELPFLARSADGWFAVQLDGAVGWASGQTVRPVDG